MADIEKNIITDARENADALTKGWLFLKRWGFISLVILAAGFLGGTLNKYNTATEARNLAQAAINENANQNQRISVVEKQSAETATAVTLLAKSMDEFKSDNKSDHNDIKQDVKEIRRILEERQKVAAAKENTPIR